MNFDLGCSYLAREYGVNAGSLQREYDSLYQSFRSKFLFRKIVGGYFYLLIFGWLGIHKFYLGRFFQGMVQLGLFMFLVFYGGFTNQSNFLILLSKFEKQESNDLLNRAVLSFTPSHFDTISLYIICILLFFDLFFVPFYAIRSLRGELR